MMKLTARTKSENWRGFCLIVTIWWSILCPLAARAEDAFFTSNGIKIHYIVQGQGEPVMLIHSLAPTAEFDWMRSGVMPALAQNYRVIALDCRGHGKSDKPHDPNQYGMQMVLDVVRLLDHLKIKKAHMVGYGMGSHLILKLLAAYRKRVLSVVLGDDREERKAAAMADALETGPDNTERFALLFEHANSLRFVFPPFSPHLPYGLSQEETAFYDAWYALLQDMKALACAERGMKQWSVTGQQLHFNRVPIASVSDSIEAEGVGMKLQGRLAGLDFWPYIRSGRGRPLDEPDYARAIKTFLENSFRTLRQRQTISDTRWTFHIDRILK